MKKQTAISVMAVMLLTVFSLVSVNNPPALEPKVKAIIQTNLVECNATTYQIYPEAMTLWNATWNEYYSTDTTDAGIRTIAAENLSRLYGYLGTSLKGSLGVRMFYGLINEDDSIPTLFLINTSNCQGRKDDPVLMVSAIDPANAPVNKWINLDEALVYINNWSSQEREDGQTVVYAYNYSWDQVWDLVGSESTEDLHIIYGLRTLSPQENETDFGRVEEGGLYGSIVYVNVLYTSDDEDPVITETDPIFDDFTRPCPMFCDPDTTNINPLTR